MSGSKVIADRRSEICPKMLFLCDEHFEDIFDFKEEYLVFFLGEFKHCLVYFTCLGSENMQ